jgi:hypothetical protein
MAEREVVLSYPTTNESGNPTLPSPFLDEVRACTSPLPETVVDPTAVVPEVAACAEEAELLGRAAVGRWSRRPGGEPDRLTRALDQARPALARRQAAIDRRAAIEERRSRYFLCPHLHPQKEGLADAFVGRLGELGSLPARIGALRWTPARLDPLGACGFRFFAREALGLQEDEEPEAEVGRAERGTLAHRVLEELFRAAPALPTSPDGVRALLAGLRERVIGTIGAKDEALIELAWRQVTAAVEELLALETARAAEQAAAGLTVSRALERPVTRSVGGLTVGGTPDRIDVLRRAGVPVGLRVIDYKMSTQTDLYARLLDPKRDLGRTSFQIPVYLLGAVAAVPELGADAELEGGYIVLRAEDKEHVRRFARADLGEDGAADGMVDRIVRVVARARAGRFDVDPDPCNPYCAYRAVCRYQRPPLEDL